MVIERLQHRPIKVAVLNTSASADSDEEIVDLEEEARLEEEEIFVDDEIANR